MEPLGALTTLVGQTRYLVDIAETMQQNKEECKRLVKHADEAVGLVQNECVEGVPVDLDLKLVKLSK